jgi:ribonuclease R
MQSERSGKGAERQGVLSVNPRGFGFVSSAGFDDDLFISEERIGAAMHGDLVTARLIARSARGSEGEVLRVVQRATAKVPGVLRRRGKAMWLEPDDSRIRGPIVLHPSEAGTYAARDGEDGKAAVARITRFPEMPRETPEGELEVVLGNPGDPNVEVAKILVREAIEEPHPIDAVREAEAFGTEVARDACAGREDLTHLPLPTIDPEDARDHDDAVWGVREADGSYKLWIAIADVSHYVRPGTALDQAALARGCSIYIPDRAVPMLPRALSSHLCSLLPNTIRLCLCVEAKLSATGEVTSFRLIEGFMKSAAKLTYGGVARALGFTDKPPRSPEAENMVSDLRVLYDASMLLRGLRMRRGALDFELPEVKIVLDKETGAPIGIEKRSEDPGVKKAYQLIEELMLLANELVARHLAEKAIPAIYRVHGPPDEKKLDRFSNMATTLGVAFDLEDAKDPKRLTALLKRVAHHPSRDVFNMLLLRAMKQATYDTANIGHFGLASTTYLHFTSPIRRYPDLVVHRAVREMLNHRPADKSANALESLKMSATMASERERHAMEVEREVVDLYRALYMRAFIGASFTGKVTALVGSGVFVQLPSPFVDVLVRSESLGADRYELDDDGMRMVGTRSGDVIALGDAMEVVIDDVAILRRSVYGRRVGAEAPLERRRGMFKREKRGRRPDIGAVPVEHVAPRASDRGVRRATAGKDRTRDNRDRDNRPTRENESITAANVPSRPSRGGTAASTGRTEPRKDFDRNRPARPGNERDRSARPGNERDRSARPGNERDRPARPGNERDRPARPGNERDRSARLGNERDRSARPRDERDRPARPGNERDRPARPGNERDRPARPRDERDRPARPGNDRDRSRLERSGEKGKKPSALTAAAGASARRTTRISSHTTKGSAIKKIGNKALAGKKPGGKPSKGKRR